MLMHMLSCIYVIINYLRLLPTPTSLVCGAQHIFPEAHFGAGH